MKRRTLLAGMAGLGAAAGVGGLAGFTFRWHATPGRYPALTDAHLQGLADLAPSPTRVLFVGNSMVLHHDVPALVAARAQAAGHPVQTAMAAGRGARLIETWKIEAFRAALRLGWDILVLQDYSGTPLRAPDRWGSAWAMRAMAEEAGAKGVLLYPTWPIRPGTGFITAGRGSWPIPRRIRQTSPAGSSPITRISPGPKAGSARRSPRR